MTWQVAYVMPNISIQQKFETNYLALVPFEDERVQQIITENKDAERLVTSFVDSQGRAITPSIMLIHSEAPSSVWTDEAILNFRNIIAISIIIFGWANANEYSGGSMVPLYSDFFDFYPVSLSKNGGLITITPALRGYSSAGSPFLGVRNASLPTLLPVEFFPDNSLYVTLVSIWERAFVLKKKTDKYTRVLFRSLEMAYHALALPSRNQSTLYDFGLSISLWVSALEVLGHIETEHVDQEFIINYLGRFSWYNPKLNHRRYSIRRKRKVIKVSLLQKLTRNLYDSRNAFLHGNEVSSKYLYSFHNMSKTTLIKIAPVIFRTALWIYLSNELNRKQYDVSAAMAEVSYESCLEQLQR